MIWRISLTILCLILLFSSISTSTAKSENLYVVLIEKEDLLNEHLAGIQEEHPSLFSLFGNQRIAIHTPDNQIVGLILRNGEIVEIIQGEPEDTTVDIFADMETIENIKTADDFLRAWREDRIKVIFRNPISDNPIASSAGLAVGVFAFGFFYYFTGNYYSTKKFLVAMFSMFGLIKRKEPVGVEKEMATERMLFSILGWKGKGYKPKNNYARLLIGHEYFLKGKFTPLKEFKQVKIKLRYDENKLKIDDSEHDAELPESKEYHLSIAQNALPEMQLEATAYIVIYTEWRDGIKEEGIIKIPIAINRNICDHIPYMTGNVIQWIGGITSALVILASIISPLIAIIIRSMI